MGSPKCVLCDQSKNACTHAHRTHTHRTHAHRTHTCVCDLLQSVLRTVNDVGFLRLLSRRCWFWHLQADYVIIDLEMSNSGLTSLEQEPQKSHHWRSFLQFSHANVHVQTHTFKCTRAIARVRTQVRNSFFEFILPARSCQRWLPLERHSTHWLLLNLSQSRLCRGQHDTTSCSR